MKNSALQRTAYSEFLKELLGAVFPGAFLLFSLVFIFFGPLLLLDIIYLKPDQSILCIDQVINIVGENSVFLICYV